MTPVASPCLAPRLRMLPWIVLTLALLFIAQFFQAKEPGSLLAVTAYKAHLMALGGWGGYWLDRALFPYDRPHQYLEPEPADEAEAADSALSVFLGHVPGPGLHYASLRRAVIVAACLVCVGLGA